MPLTTQVRLLRAMNAVLNGNGPTAFPPGNEPKPVFRSLHHSTPLPRSTPEAHGLDSVMLEDFYRTLSTTSRAGIHSLLVLRHGSVVAEGYFSPFQKDIWHVTYSLCKSVTGTAVGLAIEEGLFGLDDPVADYFPEHTGRLLSRRMRSVTVRHLLTMSSGLSYNEIDQAMDTEWVKGIFASNIVFEPGSRFLYNSMNSYLLSALVQTTSGQTVTEFLTPRVFEPLGFGPVGFEKSAEGIEKGGWGMYMLVEDMAKLGQLYLQNGMWQGCQLLPESWVAQATKAQIQGEKGEEYGFHMWVEGDDSYIMNGMFGQYIIVLPKHDMVLVMTAGNPHVFTDSEAHELVRETFYTMPPLPSSLPENPRNLASLRRTLDGLRFNRPAPVKNRIPERIAPRARQQRWNRMRREVYPIADARPFTSTTWHFDKNFGGLLPVILQVTDNNFSAGVQALQLEPEGDDTLLMLWEEGTGTVCIPLGLRRPVPCHIRLGRESFEASGFCEVTNDEDGNPVMKIEITLLEHSSCRLIKLRRVGDKLQMSMDEQPALMVAIETVLTQTQSTNTPDAKNTDPATRLLNMDYISRRVAKICTPVMTGTPVK